MSDVFEPLPIEVYDRIVDKCNKAYPQTWGDFSRAWNNMYEAEVANAVKERSRKRREGK